MSQTTWKLATAILAFSTLGGIIGTVSNKHALQEAERLLADQANRCPPPQIREVYHKIYDTTPTETSPTVATDPNAVCKYGVLMKKTKNGWENVVSANGRNIACQ